MTKKTHEYLPDCITNEFIQRMGEVQDIANTTVFLFSEGASYITGVVLVVDGKHENIHLHRITLTCSF